MMVGEHIGESSSQVNGAEACVRTKGDRLEVWVRDINMMKEAPPNCVLYLFVTSIC